MITCQACGSPAETNLCATHTWELSKALGDLPALLSALSGVVTRQARVHRTIGAPREPDPDWRGSEYALIRSPWALNTDAADELDRVGNELAGWTRHLLESRRVEDEERHPPTAVRGRYESLRRLVIERNRAHWQPWSMWVPAPEQPVSILAHWLLANLDAITLDEAADEILTEITQLRADLLRAVDNSPSPFYAGPCHALVDEPAVTVRGGTVFVHTRQIKCQRDLYAWVRPYAPGAELERQIVCRGWRSLEGDGCGAVHTVADRQDWLLDSIEDALLPLEEWRRALPKMIDSLIWPHRSTWIRWADPELRTDRLRPKGLDRNGREIFRGGDIIDLVRVDQPRIKQRATRRRAAS